MRKLESRVIPSALTATIAKDVFKLNKSATNPINGGPSKNPKKEIVDTKAKATLGAYNFDRPAMLYERGIMEATPNPTKRNPKVAIPTVGKTTANVKPAKINKPLT